MHLEKESLKQKAKSLLLEILSIYTPSGEEGKARGFFEKVSQEFNLPLKVTATNSYLLGKGDKVLLASHVDTVPGFIEPRAEGDTLYGRGAVDDKGPLVAMLLATWLANEQGMSVSFVALSDEENKSAGARELVRSGAKFDHIIVGEPSNTRNVVVEYRGVAHLDVLCRGEAQHSSSATKNLILEVAAKIGGVSVLPSSYDRPSIVPTIIRAGDRINVTPSELYLHFDVRYPYGYSLDSILEKVKGTFPDCEVRLTENVEPVKVSSNTPAVKAVMRGLLKQGIKPSLVRKGGTSDMNILKAITDSIVNYGPGDSRLEHTDLEKITLDEIYIGTLTYLHAIEELCSRKS